MQEGARKPQALALAAGEGVAELADGRVVAGRQAHHEVVDRCPAAGRLNLLVRGVEPRDAQVVADAVVEEVRLLRDEGLEVTQVCRVHAPHVAPGDGDAPLVRVPEAHEEAQQR